MNKNKKTNPTHIVKCQNCNYSLYINPSTTQSKLINKEAYIEIPSISEFPSLKIMNNQIKCGNCQLEIGFSDCNCLLINASRVRKVDFEYKSLDEKRNIFDLKTCIEYKSDYLASCIRLIHKYEVLVDFMNESKYDMIDRINKLILQKKSVEEKQK